MCVGLPAGALPLDPVGGFMRGAARPPRSSQRSLRVAAKAASFNSLAHWASASLLPPLAALGSAPLPLLKKAGENLLEDGLGFATECAGPPLMGSVGLVWFAGRQGGKGLVDGSLGWWKIPAARGGRRARTARTKQGRGPLAPAPALVLRALRARKTPPPPRVAQRQPAPRSPAHLRRPYGGCPGKAKRPRRPRGGRRRLAAEGRPPGPPPGLPNKKRGARGQRPPGPALFRTLRVPPPPPLPLGFPPTPKRQHKSQAFHLT